LDAVFGAVLLFASGSSRKCLVLAPQKWSDLPEALAKLREQALQSRSPWAF
jgi:hypothetical protein